MANGNEKGTDIVVRDVRDQMPLTTHYPQPVDFETLQRMAKAIAESRLFGIDNVAQAVALMLIAQAQGQHPAIAARDYHIIQGRPAKKAEAMQRDFLAAGGSIEWHTLSDTEASATFEHPRGGAVTITWDMDRAKRAGLLARSSNDMYAKYPRQMLRARTVSEGVRSVYPAATSGMYVPEEVELIEDAQTLDERVAASTRQRLDDLRTKVEERVRVEDQQLADEGK